VCGRVNERDREESVEESTNRANERDREECVAGSTRETERSVRQGQRERRRRVCGRVNEQRDRKECVAGSTRETERQTSTREDESFRIPSVML
jgi:hypothetical protein